MSDSPEERFGFGRMAASSAAVAVLLLLPLAAVFLSGVVDYTDLHFYTTIGAEFTRQFWDGEWYPRWLQQVNAGLGAPVFYFYPPVAYWIGALLPIPLDADPHGTARLLAGMGLSVFVSGVTAYLWLSQHVEKRHAFIGALIYILLPYRLFYIYLDFNLAQCWALAWFPMLLFAAHRINTGKPYGVALYAFFLALLAMTHVPSLMTFAWIPFLYAIVLSDRRQRMMSTIKVIGAQTIAMGLSALYWVPMLKNRAVMDFSGFTNGKYRYDTNFFQIEFLLGVPFVLAYIGWMCMTSKPDVVKERKQRMFFWMLMLAITVFMMLPISSPLWETITPLRYLQFPVTRFHAPFILIFTVMLVAGVIYGMRHRAVYVLSALYMLVHIGYIAYIYAEVNDWPKPKEAREAVILARARATGIIFPNEYRTVHTDPSVIRLQELEELKQQPQVSLTAGEGTFEVQEWQPRRLRVKAHIESKRAQLAFHRFYFPGWVSKGEGLPGTETNIYPTGFYGLMAMDLEQGDHELQLDLNGVKGEGDGELLSIIGLIALIVSLAVPLSYRRSSAASRAVRTS